MTEYDYCLSYSAKAQSEYCNQGKPNQDYARLCSCVTIIAGVNGAGKTTQLQIITGGIEADEGEILKQKANMKIAYLTQEFDVVPSRTVRVSSEFHPLL